MEPQKVFACGACGGIGWFDTSPSKCPFGCEPLQDVIRRTRTPIAPQAPGLTGIAARVHCALTMMEEAHMRLMSRPNDVSETLVAGKLQALIVLAEDCRREIEEMAR
jgi:hypothetical protein